MKRVEAKKVLVLGSGALKIGQAGEFDYSGSQAIKALKEEGCEVIIVNPNIATVQTSWDLADRVYFLPVNPFFVEKVIAREKPDGILLGFGGQTALNCGLALAEKKVFERHKVRVLGTPVKAIRDTEDRELFKKELAKIGVQTPSSLSVTLAKAGLKAAQELGFPVIVRAAFALGGKGSGVARNARELESILESAFTHAPQVLVEEYLHHWKEIEYEVVRDQFDNCITVCNMENFDPMGIHTGESIVVAPSQTLSNHEYHKLRELSIRVIRHLKIVGECNIQFALDPKSEDYRVIEVNARLSRSSALASKATGYPLAFIAAKLALGHALHELPNSITKKTMACFEPALDYCVVKIPRWDLQKFRKVSTQIGSEMKSVGEVMAIGRQFEEDLQKAIRMLNIGMYGLVCNKIEFKKVLHTVKNPTDKRLFAVVDSLKAGHSVKKLHGLSGIDSWFLHKLKNVVDLEREIRCHDVKTVSPGLLRRAKELGFSDKQLAMLLNHQSELVVRELRKRHGILPVVKQIDTLAAEFPAQTNYLYMTYNGSEHDVAFPASNAVLVLGSGAYHIGSSVEFDWCGVNAALAARKLGFQAIMVNFNPETVSTDYDLCDRLYFEELSLERVLDIYGLEKPKGVILSTGGQIANNLALKCANAGVTVLGTKPEHIDQAEDRHKFSKLCDSLGIDQPEWAEAKSEKQAAKFAERVGFPVLIRPSYVLSGAAMNIAFTPADLKTYLEKATTVSEEYPVVVSKFIANAKEVEIDAVANKGKLVISAITEHVENAGVHSGDATMVLPPQKLYLQTVREIKAIASKIAAALEISGPFNIQFIAKDNKVSVIECNLRASRSFPFVSKVSGHNFIELATKAILGQNPEPLKSSTLELGHVGVKVPQFSFGRLRGADPVLGVEMASTGEVACIGDTLEDAFLKAMLSVGVKIPEKNILVSVHGDKGRFKLLPVLRRVQKRGFHLYGTEHTAAFFNGHGVKMARLFKLQEKGEPNILSYMRQRRLDLVICIPDTELQAGIDEEYELRRNAVDHSITLLTNLQVSKLFLDSIIKLKKDDLEIKAWDEYV